jgi:hypothetical protein
LLQLKVKMTHNKEQKENINNFLIKLKKILDDHQMKLNVPTALVNVKHGYIGSLEHEHGELYIVDEDTGIELYATLNEGNDG